MKRSRVRNIVLFSIFFGMGVLPFWIYHETNIIAFWQNHDKIWAHRVNSIPKLQEGITKFAGIEVDLVFIENKNIFDVNHPPVESINLNLEDYFSSIEDPGGYYFWLDIKNLETGNADAQLKRLDEIVAKLSLSKEMLLVESSNYQLLDRFSSGGYTTSYYLPGLSGLSESDLQQNLQKIKAALDSHPSLGISSHYNDYNILDENFEDVTKYLWAPDITDLDNRAVMRGILFDKNVASLLIYFQSKDGNR